MSDIAHDAAFQSARQQKKQPWTPIPGSSQELALDSRADITLYHGARGPGKTDTQLMRFYRNVGRGYGPFWRGIIFDREYKNLDDLISKSKRWFNGFLDGARFLSSSSDNKWVWPTGEELLFRAVKKSDDYWNFHGQEFPFIGWNELCKYPDDNLFEKMMSCNRTSFVPEKDNPNVPPMRMEVFATTNPYGPGHNWVKQRFIDPAPNGHIVRSTTRVFDPRQGHEVDVTLSQVAIFGSYKENIYLPLKYIAMLDKLTDPVLVRAWKYGDWDVIAGGAVSDLWDRSVHVLPHFDVPHSWRIDRAFDWGSIHPSGTVWFAEADGTEATMRDGTTFCPPRGTLIAIAELYTKDKTQTNKGTLVGATTIAERIRDREKLMLQMGLIKTQPWPGPADNQIREVRNIEVDTIETLMARVGIRWEPSDKSPGSRVFGLILLRDRLEFAKEWKQTGEARGPGLFFTVNCINCIATIPMLPRDEDNPDDVDTDAEDHLYDVVRYRLLAGSNRYAQNIEFQFPS